MIRKILKKIRNFLQTILSLATSLCVQEKGRFTMTHENEKTQNGYKKPQATKHLAFAILTLIKNVITVIDHILGDNDRR